MPHAVFGNNHFLVTNCRTFCPKRNAIHQVLPFLPVSVYGALQQNKKAVFAADRQG